MTQAALNLEPVTEVGEPSTTVGADGDPLAEATWLRWNGDALLVHADRLEREAREVETKPYLPRDSGAQRACETYAKRLREAAALLRRAFP